MNTSQQAKTPLVIVTGLAVISLVTGSVHFARAAVVIGLLCVFSDFFERWIVFLWMKLAEGLGWVSSKIILTALFFVFLWPLAIAKRIFSPDGMFLKRSKKESLFETRNHQYSRDDLENTF